MMVSAKLFKLPICLAIGLAIPSQVQAQQSKPTLRCKTVGWIIKPAHRQICQGQYFNTGGQFLCLSNQKIVTVKSRDQIIACLPPKEAIIYPCGVDPRQICKRNKGPDAPAPQKLSLNSKVLMPTTRPMFKWTPVPNANYEVFVEGPGKTLVWKINTQNTQATYPPSAPLLSRGIPYTVNVVAVSPKNQHHHIDRGVFSIITPVRQKEVEQAISLVKALPIDEDKKALQETAIYTSANLFAESRRVLQARIDNGSSNPFIHRTLGDHLVSIGEQEKAEKLYLKSLKIAQQQGNKEAIAETQTALNLLLSAKLSSSSTDSRR
jgi:hypothetical protein